MRYVRALCLAATLSLAATAASAQGGPPCVASGPPNEETLASCTTALERNAAMRAELLLARALLYRRTDRRDMALSDYAEAIRLQPTAAVFFARAETYREAGDKRRALADYEAAFKLDTASETIRAARKSLAQEIERAGSMMPLQK